MKSTAVIFPFDLFGHPGTRQGAELLADALHEMLDDNKREKIPTRARAYTSKINIQEIALDTLEQYQTWRKTARDQIRQVLNREDFLFWIAGNHLGVLPVYEELPPQTLVLQFDAHLDIYNLSDCTSELSHGNFLLHAETKLPRIFNLGHRELLLRPDAISRIYEQNISATDWNFRQEKVKEEIRQKCEAAEQIFIDIDCDVFDPAFFPAVEHPMPMGISPIQLLQIVEETGWKKLRGIAISEFSPAKDLRDQSLLTLVWMLEYFFLRLYEK